MVERKEYILKAAAFPMWGNEMIIFIKNCGSLSAITKEVYNKFTKFTF